MYKYYIYIYALIISFGFATRIEFFFTQWLRPTLIAERYFLLSFTHSSSYRHSVSYSLKTSALNNVSEHLTRSADCHDFLLWIQIFSPKVKHHSMSKRRLENV
jgi:hypothetical protein